MTGFKSHMAKPSSSPFISMLSSRVHYWHQGAQAFVQEDGQWQFSSSHSHAKPVVVLAREHYQEFVRGYPVTVLSELRSVLVQEYSDKPMVFHYISDVDNNQRMVCTFVVSSEIAKGLSNSWLILPETLLLWLSGRFTNQIVAVSGNCPYYFYGGDKVPISQRKGVMCQTDNAFKIVQGIPAQTATIELAACELAEVLIKSLYQRLMHKSIKSFFRLPASGTSAKNLKMTAIAIATTCLLYMTFSSVYLTQAIAKSQSQLQSLGSDVGDLLTAQQQYEQTVTDYQRYFERRTSKLYFAHIWLVLAKVQAQEPNLEISNLALEKTELVFRGRTGRATDLLAQIKADPHVENARFTAPVLRDLDKDSFVIAITLRNTLMSQGAEDEQK